MKAIEVFIIGGGPAGSATALSLVQKLKTSADIQVRVTQICGLYPERQAIGETIPPAATEYMRKLGVSEVINCEDHLLCPGSQSVWGSVVPGFNDFFFTPIGKGYHLNRTVFNSGLVSAVKNCGVSVMENTRLLNVQASEYGFTLTIETDGKVIKKQADFVVDATGIQAKVARSLGVARNQYEAVVSVCHIYDLIEQPKKPAHTLVCAVADGWWYGTQLPNKKVLISFCTDKQSLKHNKSNNPDNWFQLLLDSGWFYQSCCDQFGTELSQPQALDIRVSPSAILSCVAGENWMAVGDAASSYDSMTSAGITKALEQGQEAGQAIYEAVIKHNRLALKSYQQGVFAAFNQYLKLHQELYCSEQRFPESAFWKNRQFSQG
ncbi:NAD(P)/FAD-dependent oxidoreductase [Marinicella rhabdoformis]|uniref:NAD(P)/FAD-dependent oxidoreductase n=1 Tax=Marinicella rhabdoformis TaxID=2580566 RepID=UPI0012AED317|nr:NAD(P)/FAD-dependent oxidoreductase [Marinicella rhabdoformis]